MRYLYRSERNGIFAGIAGGLGEYFDVDPVLVRLVFLLIIVLSGGVGIIAYIIAIFLVPKEPPTKLEEQV